MFGRKKRIKELEAKIKEMEEQMGIIAKPLILDTSRGKIDRLVVKREVRLSDFELNKDATDSAIRYELYHEILEGIKPYVSVEWMRNPCDRTVRYMAEIKVVRPDG